MKAPVGRHPIAMMIVANCSDFKETTSRRHDDLAEMLPATRRLNPSRSRITSTGNFHIDHIDAGRRFALPQLLIRRRRTQAEQRPPLRSAENTGNGAAPGHFDSL
jgi:hypothetical protein